MEGSPFVRTLLSPCLSLRSAAMAFQRIFWLASAACLSFVAAYPGSNGTNLTRLFYDSLSPGSQVILPSDPNYASETTQRWTVYNGPTYQASIKPALPSDVQVIVSTTSSVLIAPLLWVIGHEERRSRAAGSENHTKSIFLT